MREPGPDHPITISALKGRVVVRFGGAVVLDTTNALELTEASYPPVLYLPREDADFALLEGSGKTTHCPYKGEASYLSLATGGERSADAVWSYVSPYPAVAEIAGRLAFYPDRVTIEVTPD